MPKRCLLYYITDRTALAGDEPVRRRRLLQKISEAARAGVDYIQLREKDLSTRELESLARDAASIVAHLRTENPEIRTALLVNSRTDVALAVKADGVHLRADDVSPKEVRAIWKCGASTPFDSFRASSGHVLAREIPPQDAIVGVSCHSPAEVAQAAANAATFAVFAPVFEKKDVLATAPGGLAALVQACRTRIPVLALGGVTLENAQQCLDAGAAGIAAIRLFEENDITAVVKRLRG
jgi:thiamine-phosphate pyrophosphorylase